MNHIIFSIALFSIVCTNRIHAQVSAPIINDASAMFCGASHQDTLSYSEFAKCSEMLSSKKELIIKSFKITYLVPSEKGENENTLFEMRNLGSKLTKENLMTIKSFESKKVAKVFFEEIIVTERNGQSEKKLNDLLLILR
jgi:hypothetical protein